MAQAEQLKLRVKIKKEISLIKDVKEHIYDESTETFVDKPQTKALLSVLMARHGSAITVTRLEGALFFDTGSFYEGVNGVVIPFDLIDMEAGVEIVGGQWVTGKLYKYTIADKDLVGLYISSEYVDGEIIHTLRQFDMQTVNVNTIKELTDQELTMFGNNQPAKAYYKG